MTPLGGCTVVVTRERPGELGRLLVDVGATVLHVPLIEITEPLDDGRLLRTELARLDDYDWLIVTSPAGAERVGAAARSAEIRLGAVGSATGRRLAEIAGRPVDLVPERQLAAALADAFIASHGPPHGPSQRVLLALGDRAADTLAERLVAAGHDVTSVVAYRTVSREPSRGEIERIAEADALLLTSGSAAQSWQTALGERAASSAPALVVAIGPTTAEVAEGCGLKVTATSADHSLAGIVDELVRRWQPER